MHDLSHHVRYRIMLLAILLATLLDFLVLAIFVYQQRLFLSVIALIVLPILVLWLVKHAESYFSEILNFSNSAQNMDFTTSVSISGKDLPFHKILASMMEQIKSASLGNAEHKQYLQTILDYLPVGVLALDHNNQVTLHNRRFNKIFKVNPYNIVAGIEEKSPAMKKILQGFHQRTQLISLDSANYKLTASTIVLASGKQKLFTLQNISEELSSQEINAWMNLLRVLAHEIMNSMTPLTSLSQSAREVLNSVDVSSLSEKTQEDVEKVNRALSVIARRSEALSYFISSYRELTKLHNPLFVKASVYALVQDVLEFMSPQIVRHSVQLDVQIQPQNLEVIIDRALIEQVLINLLKNSVEACLESESSDIQINITAELKGGTVVICVEDNGPGISSELEADIFIPFFTTKRSGSGIGLSVCKQILKAHNAELKLLEQSLPGTRVCMIFS